MTCGKTFGALLLAGWLVGCGSDGAKSEGGDGSSGDGQSSDGSQGGDGADPVEDSGAGGGDGSVDLTSCVTEVTEPVAMNGKIILPDSLCDDAGCKVGGCDPKGDSEPACNAWVLEAKGAFQAVTVKPEGEFGLPPPPQKSDDDPCPGFQVQPEGAASHCCQRVASQGDKPAFKLTGLEITRPPSFASAAVAQTNKAALEGDLYNWAIAVDGTADGSHMAETGNALPSPDGSFSFLRGPVMSAGQTFNADEVWDAPSGVAAELSTGGDGSRALCVGPIAQTDEMTMAMWFDDAFDYIRLTLPVRDAHWALPLDADLLCAGNRVGQSFELKAQLQAFLLVESTKNASLALAKSEGSKFNLCALTAGAASCEGKASTWK